MAQSKKIRFEDHEGLALSGVIDWSITQSNQFALFAHCFTCSKELKATRTISKALTDLGINVLRFDFAGLGKSEGEFEDTNFSNNVSDLVAASEYLKKHYSGPTLLIGHSLGGAAVLAASEYVDTAKAVVTIGAPSTPEHVIKQFQLQEAEIMEKGKANVMLGGRTFTVKKQFLDDLHSFKLENKIQHLNKALLIFHSPVDTMVSIHEAAEIYLEAKHPKSFISLDKADHLLTNNEDAEYVANNIAAWAKRYLEKNVVQKTKSNEVVVETERGLIQQVQSGSHQWISDEPVSAGGEDKGPDPYQLLLSALGACTNMTLMMYAKFKKIDINNIKTTLSHSRNYEQDCKQCDESDDSVQLIARNIEIQARSLDADQMASLQKIADKCPVHTTLVSTMVIESDISNSNNK